MNILVTGAAGQLGQCLQIAAKAYPNHHFSFKNSTDLDIASAEAIESIFSQQKYDFCINAAAYTNVEKAESEPERAFLINAEAVKNLAKTCKKYQTKLIHVSTDYVFDGQKEESYSEEDKVNPINVYGASKLKGEKYILEILETYFIIRTSWLYSQFGHNFFKTILQKAKEEATLNITTEQKGNPTNANDLAALILKIIEKKSEAYGIYHFSNLEKATWYDFAKSIVNLQPHTKAVLLASSSYKTKAKRPLNSCLNKIKVISTFGVSILPWHNSLENLYQTYIK